MSAIFVVAGNEKEYRSWCRENQVSPLSPLVCSIPENCSYWLEDTINPQVEFYGTYYDRRDISEIKDLVAARSFRPNIKVTIKNDHTTSMQVCPTYSDFELWTRSNEWYNFRKVYAYLTGKPPHVG
ncbi:MAG: hypothetical protein ACWGNI_00050 [Desulfobacterales bacterium]